MKPGRHYSPLRRNSPSARIGQTLVQPITTYRGANLPTGMSCVSQDHSNGILSSLSSTFQGTVYDRSTLAVGGARYNAATVLTVSTNGTTGRTDFLAHLATAAAGNNDYVIVLPVDTLTCPAGTNYTIPAKSFTNRHLWIVNSAVHAGTFAYAVGTKVPDTTVGFSILEGPASTTVNAIVEAADSANCKNVSFHGVYIRNGQASAAADVSLGIVNVRRTTSQTTLSGYQSNWWFDRCILSGSSSTDVRRGILCNFPYLGVTDCRIKEIHCVGNEAAGIAGWTGSQFHDVRNVTIEAATQTLLYGGADPDQPNTGLLDPSDIYIEKAYFFKPLSWLTTHPSYAGTHWSVKLSLESKNVRRLCCDMSWSQNGWVDAQTGNLMLFQNLSDGNTNYLTNKIEDIIIRNHRFDYAPKGLVLASRVAYGGPQPTNRSQRLVFDNFLMTRIGGTRTESDAVLSGGYGAGELGRVFSFYGDLLNLVLDRVTCDSKYGPWLATDISGGSPPGNNWTITNQVARLGTYGVTGCNPNLSDACISGLINSGNVGYDFGGAPSTMGAGWDADETNASMLFQDYANYDYRLTSAQLTKGYGGGVPGCDITTLNTLLSGINS